MRRSLAAVLTAIAILLCSCGSGSVKLEFNGEGFLADKNGNTYDIAPIGYEPTSQGEEYGICEYRMTETLYRIGELDPEKWLTTEYADSATTLYYSTDITLPTLYELSVDLCHVCETGEAVASIYTLGDGNEPEAELAALEKIISMLEDESTPVSLWPRMNASSFLDLKVYSEDWPAFYYNLTYAREGEHNYVYDAQSRKCIDVGDTIEVFLNVTDK